MLLIDQITDAALQNRSLALETGTFLSLTLYFRPMQYGWFIEELTYQDFTLKGVRITNSPNMLHQFKNQIPFGLACFSDKNREPSQSKDFLSGASRLYVLSAEECQEYTDLLKDG